MGRPGSRPAAVVDYAVAAGRRRQETILGTGNEGRIRENAPLSFPPCTLLDLDLRKPAADLRQEHSSPGIAAV